MLADRRERQSDAAAAKTAVRKVRNDVAARRIRFVLQAAVRPPPTADEVFKLLTAPKTTAKKSSSASHEESVKIKGKVAFRIARRDGRVAIKFARSIDPSAVKELADKLKDVAEAFLKGRTS